MKATHMPLVAVGSILLAAAVICNQWSLAIFSSDGEIASTKALATIWAFQLICIIVGGCFIVFHQRISLNSVIVKIFNWLVFTVFGFVACSVALFGAFEVFPALLPQAIERNHLYYIMKSRYVFDAELGYQYAPHYELDQTYFGDMYYRTMEPTPEPITFRILHDENGHHNRKVPSDPDIAVLGDSWLWVGHDWSDTFAARLEAQSGYVTYNLGVNGYGPHQYLVAFNRYAAGLNPRVALFFFYEGNDIEDVGFYKNWKETGKSLGFYEYATRLLQGDFFDRYGLFNIFTLTHIKLISAPALPAYGLNMVELQLADKSVRAGLYRKSDLRVPDELIETREWQELEKVLTNFKLASQAVGTLPVLVYLPLKAHIYAKHTGNNSDPNWLAIREREIANEKNREETFSSIAERLQMELISLTPAFKAKANEGALLYYPFDTHWNSTARALAVDVVEARLKKLLEM